MLNSREDSWKLKSESSNYSSTARSRLFYDMNQPSQQMYNNQQNQYNQSYSSSMHQHSYPLYSDTSVASNAEYGQSSQQYESSNNLYNRQNQYYPMVNEPRPPGEEFLEAPPPPTGVWPQPPPPPSFHSNEQIPSKSLKSTDEKQDLIKKEAAIAQEVKQQRATLIKQREEYNNKSILLQRELDMLKEQKQEILDECGSGNIPRDSQRILKENAKLQVEIQNKLNTINNVIDILSGIIGEELDRSGNVEDIKSNKMQKTTKRESRSRISRSPGVERKTYGRTTSVADEEHEEYNYVHYDPERHWCRTCDVFPSSAKDYLLHLHSSQHCETSKQHELADSPWHNVTPEPELPSKSSAPVKRIPIKGLQFFNPATAWYCRLCDKWMGDLHCASLHLKSKTHVQNYKNFVEQNPRWESEWMSDREKAYRRATKNKDSIDTSNLLNSSDLSRNDSPDHKKKKKKRSKDKRVRSDSSSERDKKKRKKSKKKRKIESSDSSSESSSSSDTSSDGEMNDKSKSIRVMMRNKMKMQAQKILSEEFGDKLEALSQLMEEDKRLRRVKIDTSPIQQPLKSVPTAEITSKKYEGDNDAFAFKSNLKRDRNLFEENVDTSEAVKDKFKSNREETHLDALREYTEQKEKALKLAEAKLKEDEAKYREETERNSSYLLKKERTYRVRRYESPENEKRYDEKKYGERYSPDREKYDGFESPSRHRKRFNSPIRKSHDDKYGSPPDRKQYYDKKGMYSDKYQRNTRHKDERNYEKNSGSDSKDRRTSSDHESNYEKGSSESSMKSKKEKASLSGTFQKKLPFIGRMPLFKNKKQESEEKKEKEENEKSEAKSKFQQADSSILNNLPVPGLVHIYKLSSAASIKINPDNPPPPPQIIPDPPQISTYMEIPSIPVPFIPPVPMEIPRPIEQKPGNLPRDFQDALNIIFPKDNSKTENEIVQESEDMQIDAVATVDPVQYPGIENYGYQQLEYEQIMQDYTNVQYMPPLPPTVEPNNTSTENTIEPKVIKEPLNQSEIDDLALLGIDAEDMAAQNLI